MRVDILERLADLIRPAIAYRPGITPGEPPAGAADGEGFVPTVAMTSLVGCAGEDFATILKSLGYVMDRRPGPAITVPLVRGTEGRSSLRPHRPRARLPLRRRKHRLKRRRPAVATEEVGAVAVEAPEASVSEQELETSAVGGPGFARRSGSGSLRGDRRGIRHRDACCRDRCR